MHLFDNRCGKELQREMLCLWRCAPSAGSDLPAHSRRLISLRCPPEETLDPWLYMYKARSADSDQTARMRKLI